MKTKKEINIKSLVFFFAGVLVLSLIDQYTKIAAVSALKGKEPFVLIKDVLEFYYLENTGMAWGMMAGGRTFFIILTVIILAALIYAMALMPAKKKMVPMQLVFTLIGAGAVGNFIDRLCLGYVRDFIYVKLIDFPVFNVADIYVTVSIFCFAVLIFFFYKDEEDFDFLKFNKDKAKEQ